MEISEIKSRLSIRAVLRHYGLQPGKNGMLKCPFHADDTPSLKIYPETNTFNCFGCEANGDVIEFIQLKEKCTKHQALVKATELCGESAVNNNHAMQHKQTTKDPEQNSTGNRSDHRRILSKIFTYFRNGMLCGTTKRPKEYLHQRNLKHDLLEIGYNSGQFHHRGQLSETEKQACIHAGLLIPYKGSVPNANGTTYTAFAKECIIFPLKNMQDQIVSLYGRSIIDNKNAKHYYTANRCGLYPGYPKQKTIRLILTEAIIDAATLLQIPEVSQSYEVLALYGTNGLAGEHAEALGQLENLQEIIFFFDGDNAGKQAIAKYQNELSERLPHVKLSAVETPEGEDVNSLYQAYDNAEYFLQLLKERKSFLLSEEPEKEKETVQTLHATSQQGALNTSNPEFITYTTEDLQIIILGGINLQQLDRLRLTLKITSLAHRHIGQSAHYTIRHTLDLYHSGYLEKFINKACEQLETGTNVLKRAIAEMTEQIEQYRLSKIESQKEQKPRARQLTSQRQNKAINYLKAPKLMERTNNDIGRTGMIGEENNRLLMYLVFTSRLREQPLHIISLGASGTGKTYLQERVSELIPEQDKLEITILSENAFYYFGQRELKNKLVLIEDMDGAENVLYPLRELQSKKRISKTIPIKDSKGNLKTITLKVEGPICLAGRYHHQGEALRGQCQPQFIDLP